MLANFRSISSCKINILHAKFCTIPCQRIRHRAATRILEKTEWQRLLLSSMCTKTVLLLLLLLLLLYMYYHFSDLQGNPFKILDTENKGGKTNFSQLFHAFFFFQILLKYLIFLQKSHCFYKKYITCTPEVFKLSDIPS